MSERIHAKGATKIYNMLRKPRAPFRWNFALCSV